jgi:hypothetical protein
MRDNMFGSVWEPAQKFIGRMYYFGKIQLVFHFQLVEDSEQSAQTNTIKVYPNPIILFEFTIRDPYQVKFQPFLFSVRKYCN